MLIGSVTGVITALLTSIVFAIVRRFKFTTKNQEAICDIQKNIVVLA